MINELRAEFMKRANNWIIKPVQSMMDMEIIKPETLMAINEFLGIKQPELQRIPLTHRHQRPN